MSDYSGILKGMPPEGLKQLSSFMQSKAYLEMVCKTISRSKSHTIHYGDKWKIELKTLTDIDTLSDQLAKVLS